MSAKIKTSVQLPVVPRPTPGRCGLSTPDATISLDRFLPELRRLFADEVITTVTAGLHTEDPRELWFFAPHDPSAPAPEELQFARHVLDCLVSTGCICAQHRAMWARAIVKVVEATDTDNAATLMQLATQVDPVTVWTQWPHEVFTEVKSCCSEPVVYIYRDKVIVQA